MGTMDLLVSCKARIAHVGNSVTSCIIVRKFNISSSCTNMGYLVDRKIGSQTQCGHAPQRLDTPETSVSSILERGKCQINTSRSFEPWEIQFSTKKVRKSRDRRRAYASAVTVLNTL